MKQSKTILFTMLIAASLSLFTACKKDDDNSNNNQNTTKTLDKAKLVGKKWYSQNSTYIHDIKSGGVYFTNGTWSWKNNTDTMIVDIDGAGNANNPEEWKFFWSEDNQMACKRAKSGSGEILFKDQAW